MDRIEPTDTEQASYEADLRRARREYFWFSIILLCVVALAAIKAHR